MTLEKKIMDLLTEATATSDYPASATKDVSTAQPPKANSVDKSWPVEAKEEDPDAMISEDEMEDGEEIFAESDDDFEFKSDDDELTEEAEEDEEEITEENEEDEEEITEEEGDEDDFEKTFSEMISRLREEDEEEEKPEEVTEEEKPEEEPEEVTEADEADEDEEIVESKVAKKPAKKAAKKVTETKKRAKKAIKEEEEPEEKPEEVTEEEEPVFDVKDEVAEEDDLEDDANAMFAGENLPESFKKKAKTVFEAAVRARVAASRKRIAESATKKLKEAYTKLAKAAAKKNKVFEANLTKEVDRYLTYVAEEWMQENRLAVESGIRTELSEDFIRGLKKLFTEHYIEVPPSKIDVVKTMGKKLAKLEERLNEQTRNNVKLRESIHRYRRNEIVRSASRGLTDTQAEKLAKLSEGVTYSSSDQFEKALQTLKESYFPKQAPKSTMLSEETSKKKPQVTPINEDIARYSETISRRKNG